MIKPRALRHGDRLAVIAPASPFGRDDFEAGVGELRRLGFDPVYDDTVFSRKGYVAGDAESRAKALQRAWRDETVAGIIAVRGGYGSVQLLPWLDAGEVRAAPKIFVGYSDLTSLLIFFSTGCDLVCFHGPTLAGKLGRGEKGYDRDSFLRALARPEPVGELAPPGLEVIKPGEATGPLHGGTLTQIAASLGTPFAFAPPPGHVLFLEEVGERPYRIDRMLTQLRFAGILERAVAVVFGELPGCDEPNSGPTARAAVSEIMNRFRGPVLAGFPSGHTTGPTVTLPLGVQTRVVAGPSPRLVIEEAAVE